MKTGAKETGGMQIREQCLNSWLEIKFRELLRFFGAWQYILPLKFFFFSLSLTPKLCSSCLSCIFFLF